MSALHQKRIADWLKTQPENQEITVSGWVRTKRGNKDIAFIALSDGSTINNLQIVADLSKFDEELLKKVQTGCSLRVTGNLVASQGAGQAVDLSATKIEVLGEADAEKFPLQKKKHTLEFLREIAHLRPRTNTFGAILRIRHALAFAIHKYFNDNHFYYIHAPIITGSDAEGAGEMFRVTTLDAANPPRNEDGSIDSTQDFFGKDANLTVSGQLESELAAMALSRVYTFGPTFRAENSNTTRHLAEFWMIEPEMAFFELEDNMDLAEDFLKYLIRYAMEHCADDLAFLEKRLIEEESQMKKEDRNPMALLEKLNFVAEQPFERLTYTEAISILERSGKKFEYPVKWGVDLQSEHERYLVEKHFKKPVILTNYPKDIKAFYMKQDEDGKTVRAMDVLFPGIGEIIGGSQREEDYEKLSRRIDEMKIHRESLWWYLETRQYGTVPHSGFGLGFERLVLFVTGMGNIRDVIPFPRTPKNLEF
ncbi:MAG TPA: asparagine--tRNA ligase [Flavobacteriales bacterium]|jgi:asparaginyl-tRNA synthetase|nr:asparagine--tRNA ligase [Flavobacteriales bacterium]HPH83018.1 asparagine--tRNA ligase [Flavobacteriales bacterium]